MNTTETAAPLQLKTPSEIYLVLNAGDNGEHLWSDRPVTENGTQNAGPYVLRTASNGAAAERTPTEAICELLAPYLAKVQAIADSRPELKATECRFTCRIGDDIGLMFAAFFDHGDGETVGAHGRETADDAIAVLASNVRLIPAPPTREQLIAQKEAELAALKGGKS